MSVKDAIIGALIIGGVALALAYPFGATQTEAPPATTQAGSPACAARVTDTRGLDANRDPYDNRVLLWTHDGFVVGFSTNEDSTIYAEPYCAITDGREA